jgi:hypothetical protein
MIVSSIVTIPSRCCLLHFPSRKSPQQNYLVTTIPDFRLFDPLKDSRREQCFADDDALQNAPFQWLKKDSIFYQEEVHVLV